MPNVYGIILLNSIPASVALSATTQCIKLTFPISLRFLVCVGSKPFRVIMSEEAKQCRPYIVGCVVRHLRLDRGDNFKRFMSLQVTLVYFASYEYIFVRNVKQLCKF